MAFDFPSSPTEGSTYSPVDGPQYVFRSGVWKQVAGGQSPVLTALPRNRITNPAFQISQENGGTASGTNGYFLADQWLMSSLHGGVHSARSLSTNAPAARTAGAVSCTTADASMAAGDLLGIYQPIEGLSVADFYWGDTARAKPAVLRFTAWSANGGTFCVALRNAAIDASFVSEFTLAAGVWADFIVPVPACTIGTAWPSTNVLGGSLLFSLMCGSTYQTTTPNAWVAGDKRSTASQTNLMGTVGNDFRVTSVGLYLDPDGTGQAPGWELPNETDELQRCQRYYEKSYNTGVVPGTVGGNNVYATSSGATLRTTTQFMTRKRTIPTGTVYNSQTGAAGTMRGSNGIDYACTVSSADTFLTYTTSGVVDQLTYSWHWVASARM